MASASRLPLKSIAFTAAVIVGTGASRVNFKNLFISTFTGPGSKAKILATLLIITNFKNVPWAWHVRVFSSIFKHFFLTKPNVPSKYSTTALFAPVITSSRSPFWECDYNLHKSNSTYFSDLDITRSHLVCCLLEPGIASLHYNTRKKLVLDKDGTPNKGSLLIMLGSVMCSFKREIGMYEGYEMWSRLLCWDRKWIYVVTHFVKKGAVKPSAYILTDGSWFGRRGYTNVEGNKGSKEIDEKFIFASAVSKYVVKLGRLTVHPEVVLDASHLLPERPGGWAKMQGGTGESTPESFEKIPGAEGAEGGVPSESSETRSDAMDWRWVEAEKEKGLKFVAHFSALDELHNEFSGSTGPALGKYADFLL